MTSSKSYFTLCLAGSHLVWESYKLDPYVQKLAEMVFGYQEKVDDLLAIQEQIERDVQALETCHYSIANFREILNKIQKGTTARAAARDR